LLVVFFQFFHFIFSVLSFSKSIHLSYAFRKNTIILNEYLDINFREWAEENPDIWGNEGGWYMFNSITAFDKGEGDVLTHDEKSKWFYKYITFSTQVYHLQLC
jgi:hypothetical protein